METQKTPLFNLHKKYGAKFVQFAGYEMPIQYKLGIIEEHNLTRSKSGIFDVSHMGQLFIKGNQELITDLEKIFPTDLTKLLINQSKYSFLMNDNGGINDDLIITKLKDGFMIILNALCKENDFQIIKFKLKNKYEMKLRDDLSLIAFQGPEAKHIFEKIVLGSSKLKFMHGGEFIYNNQKVYISRSGYTGEDGFEISVSNKIVTDFVEKLIEHGSNLIGLGARDTLRLEAGLCLYGHDINEKTSPIEANLKWAISKSRIDSKYPGSERIKKELKEGVDKLRVGIKPESRIIARESTKIFDEKDNIIGEVTSGTFGPSVKSPIAMGYVSNSHIKSNTKVFLQIRGKKIPANICDMPFYKKNYMKEEANV